MLGAAVDHDFRGVGLIDAMLEPVRRFVLDDPEPGDWGLSELDYMERNAPLFEAYLRSRL